MWNKILNSVVLSVCFIMQIVGYIVNLRELNVLTEPSSKWLAGCSNGKVKHHIQAPEGGSSEPWSPAIFSPEPGSPMIFYSGARIDFPSGALEPRSFALEPWSWLPLLVLFFVFFLFSSRFPVTTYPAGLSVRHSTGLLPWNSLQNLLFCCLGDWLHPRSWYASVRPLGRPQQVLLVHGRQVPRYILLSRRGGLPSYLRSP